MNLDEKNNRAFDNLIDLAVFFEESTIFELSCQSPFYKVR